MGIYDANRVKARESIIQKIDASAIQVAGSSNKKIGKQSDA